MNFKILLKFGILAFAGFHMACGDFAYAHDPSMTNNRLYLGPQLAYLKRTRKGGTKQDGPLYGVRVGYDRLKRYGWYLGLEGSYSHGKIRGKTGADVKIHSRFTDMWAEARGGYTFQRKHGCQAAFTPFLGAGYLTEKNNFVSPSPLHLHFKTKYPYALIGFLTSFNVNDSWNIGLMFRTFLPFDPRSIVSNDPKHDSVTQNMGERLQYRVNIPITYKFVCYEKGSLTIEPFYEYRHYGTHVNFPFDYFKTELQWWGILFKLDYDL
ncbi:MAG: hypothetical protein ACK4HV_01160 [Parachlamydiaceae bacterium]